jgi:4-hydroxybenzoyl-CoA reductase subunit beta
MLRLPRFRYWVPGTLAEAVALKREHGDRAAFVSGGTGLLPGMKRGQYEPEILIPLRQLRPPRAAERTGDGLLIHAGATLAELAGDPVVRKTAPVLAAAASRVATPLVRNLATVGGNLCLDTRCSFFDQSREWREAVDFCLKKNGEACRVASASKRCWAVQSGDLAPLAIAVGASLELLGPDGPRRVAAGAFYHDDGIDYLNKGRDDLVTGLRVPEVAHSAAACIRVAARESFDYPVLTVAAWIRRESAGGPVAEARVVLGSIGSAPVAVSEAAEPLVGGCLEPDAIAAAAEAAWARVRPMENTDQSARWRRAVVRPYVTRVLQKLAEPERTKT